jgi:hypothetical protein
MKKIFIIGALAAVGATFTGCNDFLNDNRYPLTTETDSPTYWGNTSNVQLQVDRYYLDYTGYGNGQSTGVYYFKTLSDDQCGGTFATWKYTSVPATSSNWSDNYTSIRGLQLILEGMKTASPALSAADRANYEGIVKLNRARTYYELVRMYGDVTWIDGVPQPGEEQIYGARTDRKVIMDSVMADLDYAIAGIKTNSGNQVWSKDLARAIKCEAALFEGTFWKYCTQAENGVAPDQARATKYLQLAAQAAQDIMNSSAGYALNTATQDGTNEGWDYNYGAYQYNYNQALKQAAANKEMIFMKAYNVDVFMHSTIDYTCGSTAISGITKDAFDAYLFKDGKPKALTTLDNTDVGVAEGEKAYSIQNLLDVRDARLAATTDPYVYYKGMGWTRGPKGSIEMTSTTGYGVAKYDNCSFPVAYRSQINKNYSCAPLYWLAVIYLNYAEAKAELGTLTDADLDMTINKLYARAELPSQTVASLTSMNDPANNMNVSSLIWEIRRCRRCELIMDNDFRYWDLIRWHQLELLDTNTHPNIVLGANYTGAPIKPGQFTGDYVNGSQGGSRTFEYKHYLYPIPSGQIALAPALGQNYGW